MLRLTLFGWGLLGVGALVGYSIFSTVLAALAGALLTYMVLIAL
jgi:hypothetical protein